MKGQYQKVLLDRDLRRHYLAKASEVLHGNGYLLEPVTPEERRVYSVRNGLLSGILSCHVGLEFKSVYVFCFTSKPHVEQEFEQFIDDCLNIATRRFLVDDEFMKRYYKSLNSEFLITFEMKGGTHKALYRSHDITDLLSTKATVHEICTYINYVEDGNEYCD